MGRPKNSKDKKKRKTRVVRWTPEEIRLLEKSYYGVTRKDLVALLKKSWAAIRTKARDLGLRKPCFVLGMNELYKLRGRCGVFGVERDGVLYVGGSVDMEEGLSSYSFSCDIMVLEYCEKEKLEERKQEIFEQITKRKKGVLLVS